MNNNPTKLLGKIQDAFHQWKLTYPKTQWLYNGVPDYRNWQLPKVLADYYERKIAWRDVPCDLEIKLECSSCKSTENFEFKSRTAMGKSDCPIKDLDRKCKNCCKLHRQKLFAIIPSDLPPIPKEMLEPLVTTASDYVDLQSKETVSISNVRTYHLNIDDIMKDTTYLELGILFPVNFNVMDDAILVEVRFRGVAVEPSSLWSYVQDIIWDFILPECHSLEPSNSQQILIENMFPHISFSSLAACVSQTKKKCVKRDNCFWNELINNMRSTITEREDNHSSMEVSLPIAISEEIASLYGANREHGRVSLDIPFGNLKNFGCPIPDHYQEYIPWDCPWETPWQ